MAERFGFAYVRAREHGRGRRLTIELARDTRPEAARRLEAAGLRPVRDGEGAVRYVGPGP